MSINFEGKVALITGASSGIGAATAIYFAKLGAKLSLTGRKENNLKEVAQKCKEASIEKKEIVNCRHLVENFLVTFGKNCQTLAKKLDRVNNAGIVKFGEVKTSSMEDFDEVIKLNTRSVFQMTQLATPYLIKTKGNVVNVSSINSMRVLPGMSSYCMSKAAIDQFTRCTALELAPHQVRVNSVNPSVIKTNIIIRSGLCNEEEYEKNLGRCKETNPLGRYGEAEEVASVIAFLASDGASFITAATIVVDGGSHVKLSC